MAGMNKDDLWREFEPGDTTIKSMVFDDAWYPLGVKEGRLVEPSVPGAKAAHQISIEESTGGDIILVATDGERWIALDSVQSPLGSDQWDTILAREEPTFKLTTGDRDH